MSLFSTNVGVDKVCELIEVDVAITVGVNVFEDEGSPLGGAVGEVVELLLGDATIAVGVNNLVEGVDLGVNDDLATHAGGCLKLLLGDLAVSVGVDGIERAIDLFLPI